MAAPPHFWLFGYGSLIWKQGFPFLRAETASIVGFQRRFWQGSPDHRGTPEAMGRVVTLVEQADEICWGVAFAIPEAERQRVTAQLDHREQGGYQQRQVTIQLSGAGAEQVTGMVYFADRTNPHFLGAATPEIIAEHIITSTGPSGTNIEYFVNLRLALKERGIVDPHLEEIAANLNLGPDPRF